MPLQATSGAASYDAFGGGVAAVPNYIEDVFSTYLYNGTGSAQTITNGIDLSTKGGLVWIKSRETYSHRIFDTARGVGKTISSNSTGAQFTDTTMLSAFNTTGFSLGSDSSGGVNDSGYTFASWTFRKQPKFFDVVTYTGNGVDGRDISHSLDSSPGFVVIKCTSSSTYWVAKHKDALSLTLNTTNAQGGSVNTTNGYVSSVSSTSFNVVAGLTDLAAVNASGQTYVAYLFAHDAGGFGLTGTDNVISCGSFTTNGSGNATVSLGYEPQWVLVKGTGSGFGWSLFDNMRGMPVTGDSRELLASSSSAEGGIGSSYFNPTATGFYMGAFSANQAYIYIAIRRGPMKVPTSGTSVFAPLTYTGNGTSGRYISGAGFPPDLIIQTARSASENREFDDRLRGGGSTAMNALFSNSSNAEAANSGSVQLLNQDGFTVRSFGNGSSVTYIGECFRRAPSFFDVVCYTGNGTAGRTVNHNLGVAPELMIVKRRNSSSDASWIVYAASQGISAGGQLNSSAAFGSMLGYYQWNNTAPTASVFTLGDGATDVNNAAGTYVWYGFASCAGVSKVGSYTGNGSNQTINCGFTGGARFVMIKATSTTGDWMVADSARGIVSGNDPYLELNNTNAEVTGEDWLDTDSTGFVVNEVSGSNANTNGVTYIYLAIA